MVQHSGKTKLIASGKTDHAWNIISFAGTARYVALNMIAFVSQNDNHFCLCSPIILQKQSHSKNGIFKTLSNVEYFENIITIIG